MTTCKFSVVKEEYLLAVEDNYGDANQKIFVSCDDLPDSSPKFSKSKSKTSSKNSCKRKFQESLDLGKENGTEDQKKPGKGRPHKTLTAKELSDEEVTENLIEEVAKRDCLWDISTDKETRGDKQRQDAWETVARKLGGL